MDTFEQTGVFKNMLHQMWFDRHVLDNKEPPDKYKKHQKTWLELHPHHQYILWNGGMLQKLWSRKELAEWSSFFHSLPHHIEKCDYSRYAILYLYGGVYSDLDYYCLRNTDELFRDKDILLFPEPKEHIRKRNENLITNSVMYSVPHHKFWPYLMSYIKDKYESIKSLDAVHTTGPSILFEAANSYPLSPSQIGKSYQVSPYTDVGKLTEGARLEESYTYTLWNEGTGWSIDYFEQNVNPYINLATVLILILLLIFAVFVFIL